MKRLLILSMVAVLTASASGCCLFNRGAQCNTCPTGGATGCNDPNMSAPYVTPGTDTYFPGPG